jgi:hypothetical protein
MMQTMSSGYTPVQKNSRRAGRGSHLRILGVLLLLSLSLIAVGVPVSDGANALVVNVASISAIGAFVMCLVMYRSTWHTNWFHPLILFFVSYLIVFFQVPWGVTHELPVPRFIYPYPEKINQGVVMAAVGLWSLLAGYLVAAMSGSASRRNVARVVSFRPRGLHLVISVLLVIAYALNAAFLFAAGDVLYKNFVYAGSANWGSGASYIFAVLTLVTGLIAATEAVTLREKGVRTLREYFRHYDRRVLLYILFYLAPHVLSGDRGVVIFIGLAVLSPFYLHGARMRFKTFIIGVILAAFALAFLGKMRTRDASLSWAERVAKGRTGVTALSQGWLLPTLELGGSYRTYNAAIAVVPGVYSYAEGRYLWGNLSSVIPFYSRLFPADDTHFGGSAALFFTNLLRKGDFSSGEGSSVLGAIYLDFGFVGIPVVMFILGWLMAVVMKKVRGVSSPNAILWTYFSIIVMHQAVKISRSDPFFWAQEACWGALLYYIIIRPLLARTKAVVVTSRQARPRVV